MSASVRVDPGLELAEELRRAGRLDEAARTARAVLEQGSGSASAYRLLARVECARGDRSAEAAALEGVLRHEADDVRVWMRLGEIAIELGQGDAACCAYRRATRLAADEFAAWHGLARAALAATRLPLARLAGEEMLRRHPDRAESHLIAGHVAEADGATETAVAEYRRTLELDPTSSEALFSLADHGEPSAPLVAQIAAAGERVPRGGVDSVNLEFANGRILDAAGDHMAAFRHYERANSMAARALKARGIEYQPLAVDAWVARTIDTYPATFDEPVDANSSGIRLIFIVGMPRSGTTLVEQILTSHPRVVGGGELSIAAECERLFARGRSERGRKGAVDPRNSEDRGLLSDAREWYLDRLMERDLDGEFVTDKLPGNFARLAFIRLLFPDATIVHTRRHPIATCWSLYTANFGAHEPYHHSLDHLAHFYGCYQRLFEHWRAMLRPAPIELSYEELVTRPGDRIPALITAAGLEWEPQCLRFFENRRAVLTASRRQVRRPLYTDALDRWQRYSSCLESLRSLETAPSPRRDQDG
jgi:tetratricopeptide (TPR) repeat protein